MLKSLLLVVAFSFGSNLKADGDGNRLSAFPAKVKVNKNSENLEIREGGDVLISRTSAQVKDRNSEKLAIQKAQSKKKRQEIPKLSPKAYGFEIYDANSYLDLDLDGDGFYSEFTLEFDADFDSGYADVYGVVYYSLNGGDWIELFETDVFTIYFDDAGDAYTVSFSLIEDFPTGEYDFLIDLYEDGYSGIVDTIDSTDDFDLYALPLEDDFHEVNGYSSQISYVASELSGDFDGDGFYTDLTLEYDISAGFSGDYVYAEVVMKNQQEGWQQTVYSDEFVLGNQTEFLDLTFNSGYPAGYYDIEIKLVHSLTGEVLADAAYEFSSLNGLPIESTNNDDYYNSFSSGSDVEIIVSGGGSFGIGALLMIGLLLFRQKQLK